MATGDPVARRIIFSSYVLPTQSIEGEETSVRHTEYQTSPGKALGGKGIASINEDQWGDGWVSFTGGGVYWEDHGDVWELQGELWDGTLSLTTLGTNLTDDASDLAFLYIKNTGSTNNCLVSLQAEISAKYLLVVPPGGSVHLRGDGTTLDCNDVHVKSASTTTTIEFVIAKE